MLVSSPFALSQICTHIHQLNIHQAAQPTYGGRRQTSIFATDFTLVPRQDSSLPMLPLRTQLRGQLESNAEAEREGMSVRFRDGFDVSEGGKTDRQTEYSNCVADGFRSNTAI